MVGQESGQVNGNGSAKEARCAWSKPELKRLDAGSAENFTDGALDFAENPS